jgi:methylthioribose-1-phosphate isomerase
MRIQGQHFRSIWVKEDDSGIIQTIDQRLLPFKFEIVDLKKPEDFTYAISDMIVRGAPLIGVTAAYGIYSATLSYKTGKARESYLLNSAKALKNTRPTAVDLFYSVERMLKAISGIHDADEQASIALAAANQMAKESCQACKKIGQYGLKIIKKINKSKNGSPVNILTHCNAGWLACIDYGTATAPIYLAHDEGIPVHVWVDETRPRNQGSRLTAYELGEHGVPHTVIADNTGGHLMQHKMVDMVMVGSDRTTRNGDVANKIGTYLKALAAKDNKIPFYVALPSSTIDWAIRDGIKEIPIETRTPKEVKYLEGWNGSEIDDVLLMPYSSKAVNYAFDVTPGHLVTGLISERGVCKANEKGLLDLFPEQK